MASFAARALVRAVAVARVARPAATLLAVARPLAVRSLATAAPAGGVQVSLLPQTAPFVLPSECCFFGGRSHPPGAGAWAVRGYSSHKHAAHAAPAPGPRCAPEDSRKEGHPSHFLFRRHVFRFFFHLHALAQSFLDKKEVTERVIQVLKNFEKVDPAKVTPTAHFVNDLGLDSLDAVEVREREREKECGGHEGAEELPSCGTPRRSATALWTC